MEFWKQIIIHEPNAASGELVIPVPDDGFGFLVFNLGVMVRYGLSERPGWNRIATIELSRLSLDMQAHDAYRWRRRDGTKNLQPGERAGQEQRLDERRLADGPQHQWRPDRAAFSPEPQPGITR